MVKIQLRGDTLQEWEKHNPIIAEREMILISSDPKAPDDYNLYKIGDGKHKFKALPYHGLPAVQERGNSLYDVMSQRAVTGEFIVLEEKLQKIQVEMVDSLGKGHKQNTDTGTDHRSFLINDVLLKCCCHDLVLRSKCDCDYADLTLKDLYVKGKIYVDGGIFETEVEEIRSKNNMIILNDGETGAGVANGISGIDIDRGTKEHYYIVYKEEGERLMAGKGDNLYSIPLIDGDFTTGDIATWDAERKVFVPGDGLPEDCMRMENPFTNGSIPVWDEIKGLFVEKPVDDEEEKDYMEMLAPFQQGEIPVWNAEQELFVPIANCMLMDDKIEHGDGVIWDNDKKLFVAGIPYDPLVMRKDRIKVLPSLPTEGIQEGDIVLIDETLTPSPDDPAEVNTKNPYLMKSDIADDLVTENTKKVLSARQGYILGRTNADKDGWGSPDDFKEGFRNSLNIN